MVEFFRLLNSLDVEIFAFIVGAIAIAFAVFGKFKERIEFPSTLIRIWIAVIAFLIVGLGGFIYFLGSIETKPPMISEKDGMVMVHVPAGEFVMGPTGEWGDKEARHRVYLDEFWIDQTEITNAMFATFLNEVGNQSEGGFNWYRHIRDDYMQIDNINIDGEWEVVSGFEEHPVYRVSWYGARAYCAWAGRRMPTEAEWEKAARGIDQRTYPWGDKFYGKLLNADDERNFDSDTVCEPVGCDGYDRTSAVGSFPAGASPYGALDMAGNVREWVADWYDAPESCGSYGRCSKPILEWDWYKLNTQQPLLVNPTGPLSGTYRVVRGGSWITFGHTYKTTTPDHNGPASWAFDIGFRCAQSMAETPIPTWMPTPATLLPPTATIPPTIPPTITPKIIVPAGEFIMGNEGYFSDEGPIHSVYLDSFYIDKYEVTNVQYAECVNAGVCDAPGETYSFPHNSYFGNPQYNDYPVVLVDWYNADKYCEWRGARLPTEAEWEKAARGTDGRTYPWGENIDCDHANHLSWEEKCAGNPTAVGSHPAGASSYGVHDLAGNVWEWVADWYDNDYYQHSPYENPIGPSLGTYRVLRGGSWHQSKERVRAAYRGQSEPWEFGDSIGFRCAYSP